MFLAGCPDTTQHRAMTFKIASNVVASTQYKSESDLDLDLRIDLVGSV